MVETVTAADDPGPAVTAGFVRGLTNAVFLGRAGGRTELAAASAAVLGGASLITSVEGEIKSWEYILLLPLFPRVDLAREECEMCPRSVGGSFVRVTDRENLFVRLVCWEASQVLE